MVELEAWYEPGQKEPLILREQADVDALLDQMLSWATEDPVPPVAEIDYVGGGESWAVLQFGVRPDRGFVAHVDPSGSVVSSSEQTEPPELTYDYMGNTTEVRGGEIPLSLIRQAVSDFVRTRGSRPEGITWQEVSR